ncbi:MAG: alanine racemase [Eubacteriales bacterium]|nr:alanine racemase [Eubacteriales bacterium]
MNYPALIVDNNKLKHNIDTVVGWCHARGIACFVVTKVVCAVPEVVSIIENSEADGFADSRVENLSSIDTCKDKMMLRIGTTDVRCANISLQSEITFIDELQAAAHEQNLCHKVILMIDLGDLREGIFYKDRAKILAAARRIAESENLELYGIGTNLTCYGAILPDSRNLGELVAIAQWLRKELNEPIPIISGGNSSSVDMLLRDELPLGINNLRIGECIMLGQDTARCVHIPELYDDAFILRARLIEVQEKPSKPIGTAYKNAFGEEVSYQDKGEMLRGILAVGRQDVCPDGLIPIDPNVTILGGSSDHLLVDLTQAEYATGDTIDFRLTYGALLMLSTSKYVQLYQK